MARWYTFPMTTSPHPARRRPTHPAAQPARRPTHPAARPARRLLHTLLLWTAISALGALQTYSDNLRIGVDSHYVSLLATWAIEYGVPLMILSLGLGSALARWPVLIARPRNVALLCLGLVLVYQPAHWAWIAWLRGYLTIDSLGDLRQLVLKMLLVGWFSSTATVAAILAVHYSRQARERELAWQRTRTDLLDLRLALEEQRMLALRAQLEPHFLFNALSAISALVRADDKAVALSGIARLSGLLRYALAASTPERADASASVGAELQFVRDYLDLQRLRYGERLQVRIEGESALLHDVACPPLLLQPLIENALRHDLDCHDGASDIRLSFEALEDSLRISVSNPIGAQASPNPGAGLGLKNTRDRLRLMHPAASLQAGPRDGRFIAEVCLPLGV